MSRKYKFLNKEGLYFVSFATVNWIDVFVREMYCNILLESLSYCRLHKGLELYCRCIMPSHVHLIFRAKDVNSDVLLGKIKEHTAKNLVKAIGENLSRKGIPLGQESRKEWLLWMFERAASKSSNVSKYQFWQHNNRPIELWSPEVIEQRAEYLHLNPVVSGFVNEAWHWKYSSAIDYSGGKGLIEIDYL